jgi:hypothetical protein
MIEKEVTMRRMEAQIRKLKRGMDESFRITRPDGSTYVNYTCSQGKMVTVDYFALQDLIEFYEETRVAASQVIVAREALKHTYWAKDPLPKEPSTQGAEGGPE